jgi:hypothetical protein
MYHQRRRLNHGGECWSDATPIYRSVLPINPFTMNSIHDTINKETDKKDTTTNAQSVIKTSIDDVIMNKQVPRAVSVLPGLELQNLNSASSFNPLVIMTSNEATRPAGSQTLMTFPVADVPTLDIAPNAHFEIRSTPSKGYGVFAKAPIMRGTSLLAEEPLLRIHQQHYMAQDVRTAYNKLVKGNQTKYWALSSAHGQAASRLVLISQLRQISEDKLRSK